MCHSVDFILSYSTRAKSKTIFSCQYLLREDYLSFLKCSLESCMHLRCFEYKKK